MEFDLTVTAVAFVAIIATGVGALIAAPMMTTETILMMVAPSMAVFGLICLALGVKYGEYRAGVGTR
jgi:ABC-type proline/glycine betaine transport system permease subunit